MSALLDPWSHAFMQRALVELVLLGVVCGVLGCWIVLYELSYSAESLAHALFPGLVAAALLGHPAARRRRGRGARRGRGDRIRGRGLRASGATRRWGS